MNTWRNDFPIFQHHPELAYLDSAASAMKPRVVIEAQREFEEKQYSSVRRGVYKLAQEATQLYEAARHTCAHFIHASPEEIIFTSNTTHALNLVAWIERPRLTADAEMLVSIAEHHSNFLPWQRISCGGAKLVVADPKDLLQKINSKTKLVAIAHVSNVLGGIVDIAAITKAAHAVGARVVVDAAQSAAHLPIDVKLWDVDYVAISGHKVYGPAGTGFLYAKKEFLEASEPFILGGGMVEEVNLKYVRWLPSPARFEAGTPNITGVIGLAAAVRYIQSLKWGKIIHHEKELTQHALEALTNIPGLKLYGPRENRLGIFSFTLEANGKLLHSHDVAQLLDEQGIAIRGGHHCAQPLLTALGVYDLNRASIGVYTTIEDIDRLAAGIKTVQTKLS